MHAVGQTVAAVSAAAAVGIIWSNKDMYRKDHLTSLHGKTSIALAVMMTTNAIYVSPA